MKKLFTFLAMMITAVTFAQVDSATAYHLIQTGLGIATTMVPGNIIPSIPNTVLSGFVMTVFSLAFAFFHRKRSLKKLNNVPNLPDKK